MKDQHRRGREILKKALLEYERKYCENIDKKIEEMPSREFLEFQLEQIRDKTQKRSSPLHKSFSKRLVGLAAALVIVVGTMTTIYASPALVQSLSDFYETHIKIYFADHDVQKAPSTIETLYMPAYIPEGYELDPSYQTTDQFISRYLWRSANRNYIQYRQAILGCEETIDTEDSEYSEVYRNGMRFVRTLKHDRISYHWNTNEYSFLVAVYRYESEEEVWKIIDSIQKYENTDNKEFSS